MIITDIILSMFIIFIKPHVISPFMFFYTFIRFCTNAACVLNVCCSLIKILNNGFILLSGCCDVIIKEMGVIGVKQGHLSAGKQGVFQI